MAVALSAKVVTLFVSGGVRCEGKKEETWFFELTYVCPGDNVPYPGTSCEKPKAIPADEFFWDRFEKWLLDYRKRMAGGRLLEGEIRFFSSFKKPIGRDWPKVKQIAVRVFPELEVWVRRKRKRGKNLF